MEVFDTALATLKGHPRAFTALQIVGLLLVVWLVNLLTNSLLLRALSRAVRATPSKWDDALLANAVIKRLAHIAPALTVYYGISFISGLPEGALQLIRSVASAYVVLTLALSFVNLVDAVGELYEKRDPTRARARPIKGYLQLVKLIVFAFTAILMIAALFNQDPLLLLSGLGAMTAVLILVFKDTILSLVASVQLSTQDMLRVGDWIEMPQLNADGYAIDISLHTVKVQNWDRTITTVPTWRLINESFKNWRVMYESGRQIKRSLYLDQTSVRFLTDDECERLRRFVLLDDYLSRKHIEIDAFNEKLIAQGRDPVNGRRATNVGTFRAYVQAYIEAHEGINPELFRLVRQRQPGPTGLPLEIYCYTAKTGWADYEGIQADIFDHLYAVLPEFDLRVFQGPSGTDIVRGLALDNRATRPAADGRGLLGSGS